ncbi:hypothetical protein LVJ82_03805 [Vitreoscilla massiliensis]|uniref:Aromatic-ring-hydroxylating dioxygenase subunit beta n=1 Tax=Vitreoscilla massiliensis TaxID=1689272 RepID=A0ABY4E3P3_9NEIS|nr:aromatic-ring-hydroxylating dioxygenase subunit beta [Vitreoscilla massiliensis]UOO90122.1 hypothetical protein LVJ82_03805 [Vitreoscilla massiliensis]
MKTNLPLLNEVTAFLWAEADMLDHGEYQDWLSLWQDEGVYIIPIDPSLTDYENHLNYAYDNQEMRRLRVERLQNGEAISTSPKANIVHTVSRIRILQEDGEVVVVRAAMNLREFRKEHLRHYTADLIFHLVKDADTGFKIQRKVVNLINSTDNLAGISYII